MKSTIKTPLLFCALMAAMNILGGCSGCLRPPPGGIEQDPCSQDGLADAADPDAPIALSSLEQWTRCDGPVLRDASEEDGGYETASDGHVFHDESGDLAMLQEHEDTEAIFLARAEHPFGPYETIDEPVIVRAGKPWEIHESNAPQIMFDERTRTAYLYYVGASYLYGWWILMAKTPY